MNGTAALGTLLVCAPVALVLGFLGYFVTRLVLGGSR